MDNHPHLDINEKDIRGVQFYRGGIVLSALAFVMGTVLLFLTQPWNDPDSPRWLAHHRILLSVAVWMIVIGTGTSVLTIHLYIRQFHVLLKILFGIGLVSILIFFGLGIWNSQGFLRILYETPYGTFGFGFVLAALCGIAVKEAFCFGQLEAVLFALATPVLVLGHIFHAWSPYTAFLLLCADSLFLCIFAVRKVMMPVDLDIGDKSVYM
jgi:uncharacterized integral membrane protein